MKITDIKVQAFRVRHDDWDRDHGVPQRNAEIMQTVTTIETDAGVSGHYFGGAFRGHEVGLNSAERDFMRGRVRNMLVGQDPLDRELFWKWFWVAGNMPESIGSVVDNALWDFAGNYFKTPVYKLMGGAGRRVKAYASSHKNMGQPKDYADHAIACKKDGYLAYKIHPHYFWNPETRQPTNGRPSNIKADIATIRAVREAVGPDYTLMYDPWGTYMTMEEALLVGRELERLNFYWYEHPMPETRPEMYVRLARELTIPILAPEIAAGGVFTRADWVLRGASDMSRIDAHRGGITGARKTAIICEAYGYRCELHMSGPANLHVIAATHEDTAEYYERGLLAPGLDYDMPPPYLKAKCDKLDPDGHITMSNRPGLGYDVVWDYIKDNAIK